MKPQNKKCSQTLNQIEWKRRIFPYTISTFKKGQPQQGLSHTLGCVSQRFYTVEWHYVATLILVKTALTGNPLRPTSPGSPFPPFMPGTPFPPLSPGVPSVPLAPGAPGKPYQTNTHTKGNLTLYSVPHHKTPTPGWIQILQTGPGMKNYITEIWLEQ